MAEINNHLLVVGDSLHHVGDLVGNAEWYGCHAVFVAVKQVAGLYGQSSDGHRNANLDKVDIGMRYRYLFSKEAEP